MSFPISASCSSVQQALERYHQQWVKLGWGIRTRTVDLPYHGTALGVCWGGCLRDSVPQPSNYYHKEQFLHAELCTVPSEWIMDEPTEFYCVQLFPGEVKPRNALLKFDASNFKIIDASSGEVLQKWSYNQIERCVCGGVVTDSQKGIRRSMSLTEDMFVVDVDSSSHQQLLFGSKHADRVLAWLDRILSYLASAQNQHQENIFTGMKITDHDTEFKVRWFCSDYKRVQVSLHLSSSGILVVDTTKKIKAYQWDFSKLKDWVSDNFRRIFTIQKVVHPDKVKLTVKEWTGESHYVFECYDANSVFETIGRIINKEFRKQQQPQPQQFSWASVLSPGSLDNMSSILTASIGNSISGIATKAIESGSVAADNVANSIGGVLSTIALQVPAIAQQVQSVHQGLTGTKEQARDADDLTEIGLTDSEEDIVDLPLSDDDEDSNENEQETKLFKNLDNLRDPPRSPSKANQKST